MIAAKRIIFVDSITDLTRQAMAWAKTRPEAFSEKTGKPDTRGAYGLLAREVIALLKHLQHAPGKTVIFVGILERVVDDFNREQWQPQMEGGKAGRELPGIVDQVISMSLFEPEGDGWRHEPAKGQVRRLVCRAANPFGLPAKDRSGRLDLTEPANLGALLAKINRI
jgi:AAA domain